MDRQRKLSNNKEYIKKYKRIKSKYSEMVKSKY